ncbi:MAG: PstS family phosphate ABC transporter substrate-binding protein [Thermosynechococcaceae cyanobacterium]
MPLGLMLLMASCSSSKVSTNPTQAVAKSSASTAITIDGSSTVYPITEAIAKAFKETPNATVPVNVKFSGTGGGFAKFCAGETDINDASRPITPAEIKACDQNQIRFVELPIAFDALTVVVHPQNDWVESMTVEELKKIWQSSAQQQIKTWDQVNSSWPRRPLNLYGPGTDSGTYDYFAEVIVGGRDTRSDYTASEDDSLLVQKISQDPNALGFFGLAYYEENQAQLKAIAIDSGSGSILPSRQTVEQAAYQPLARPLFLYVNLATAQQNHGLRRFVEFYLDNAQEISATVGYIPLPEEGYHIASVNFQEGEVGTAFEGQPQPRLTIAELLRKAKRFQ